MLCINKTGFTIIETMIAALLLSGVFFAIISLMNTSTREAGMIANDRTMERIASNSRACIESFGVNYLTGLTATESVNFGNDGTKCLTGSYSPALSFSGVDLAWTTGTGAEVQSWVTTHWNYYKSTSDGSGGAIITDYITDGQKTKEFDWNVR